MALFAAQLEQYERAIEVFEQIALSSIDNTLLKYSVKEYLFCAGALFFFFRGGRGGGGGGGRGDWIWCVVGC